MINDPDNGSAKKAGLFFCVNEMMLWVMMIGRWFFDYLQITFTLILWTVPFNDKRPSTFIAFKNRRKSDREMYTQSLISDFGLDNVTFKSSENRLASSKSSRMPAFMFSMLL